MIYFEGYVFKFELITLVTDIREYIDPTNTPTGQYDFFIKHNGDQFNFTFDDKKTAGEYHTRLIETIHKHGYVGGWEKRGPE